jgi:hypothetical protein
MTARFPWRRGHLPACEDRDAACGKRAGAALIACRELRSLSTKSDAEGKHDRFVPARIRRRKSGVAGFSGAIDRQELQMKDSSPQTDRKDRPDIDGMRAISIVSLVAYHAGIPGSSGASPDRRTRAGPVIGDNNRRSRLLRWRQGKRVPENLPVAWPAGDTVTDR